MAARGVVFLGSKVQNGKFLQRFTSYANLKGTRAFTTRSCTYRWISIANIHDMSPKTSKSSVINKKFVRCLSSENPDKKNDSKNTQENSVFNELMESKEQPHTQLTVGAKVVQAGKDVTYIAIIIAGFLVTGALIWYVVSELFLGFSPNTVYSYALKQVLANIEVVEELGEPIMGHGETTRRGRRRHVSYQEYIVDDENYMRVKFYVKGQKRTATVHVDVKQGPRGSIIYRFILVQLDDYPQRSIIVLDNR